MFAGTAVSTRALTVRYAAALIIVGATACAAYGVMYTTLHHIFTHHNATSHLSEHKAHAHHISTQAREYVTHEHPENRADARTAVLARLAAMDAHHDLIVSGEADHLPGLGDADVAHAYFNEEDGLHHLITAYFADVQELLRLEAEEDIHAAHPHALHVLEEMPARIMEAIARVMAVHQAESEERIATALMLGGGGTLSVVVMLALVGGLIFRPMTQTITREQAALEQLNAELEHTATHDKLTEVYNRTAFTRIAQVEAARATREHTPIGCIILDVDHFKKFNDTYGHATGDEVLKHVAASLRLATRATDYVVRWGGEEFLVIAPATSLLRAKETAEKLRACIANTPTDAGHRVTISLGVTVCDGHEPLEAAIARADEALYASKGAGRNRVTHVAPTAAAEAETAVV